MQSVMTPGVAPRGEHQRLEAFKMEIVSENTTTQDEEQHREQPPAEAERFEYIGGARMSGRYVAEWDDDPHFEAPEELEKGDKVRFYAGDILPKPFAETMWHHHDDLIAAYDGEGHRVGGGGD